MYHNKVYARKMSYTNSNEDGSNRDDWSLTWWMRLWRMELHNEGFVQAKITKMWVCETKDIGWVQTGDRDKIWMAGRVWVLEYKQ